jgi:hypothetical protein
MYQTLHAIPVRHFSGSFFSSVCWYISTYRIEIRL